MVLITCEIVWLCWLLTKIGVNVSQPTLLHCDNNNAMHIANNYVFHEQTKHIEI